MTSLAIAFLLCIVYWLVFIVLGMINMLFQKKRDDYRVGFLLAVFIAAVFITMRIFEVAGL